MKICITGDLHIRSTNPENRIDDFSETQFSKIKQALDIAKQNNCKLFICPGDMWDNPNPSKELMARYINLFKEYTAPDDDVSFIDDDYMVILTVLGQHDMTMRNLESYKKTPSYLLESAGVLHIVGLDGITGYVSGYTGYSIEDINGLVAVHGLSYGQDDSHIKGIKGIFNLLIAHASVGENGFQTYNAMEYLNKYSDMDLIAVGDYHAPFVKATVKSGKLRYIINSGCIVRKTVSEEDLALKPSVCIYNVDTRKYQMIPLDFKPAEEVFYIPNKDSVKNPTIIKFLESLRAEKTITADFTENLNSYFNKSNTNQKIIDYISKKVENS